MWKWLGYKKRFLVRVRTYGGGGSFTVEWSYGRVISWNKFKEPSSSRRFVIDYFRSNYETVVNFAKQFNTYDEVQKYNEIIESKYPTVESKIIINN